MSILKLAPKCAKLAHYEEVTWNEVRDEVININPNLALIIDECNPKKEHTFIKAWYPYGTPIRDKGQSFLPNNEGQLATIEDAPLTIRNQLGYSPSPLALILNKSVEIFVETPEGRTIPFKLFGPGIIFGVWEIMDQPSVLIRRSWDWSISAGARTIFMLPKITDIASHQRLQRAYDVRSPVPRDIFEQRRIFAEIFNHRADESGWCTELLFFTKKWLDPQPKNLGWIKLREYWAREAWRQAQYWINKMITDFNWEAYMAGLTNSKIKLKPYLLDTVRHFAAIGSGTIPAFRPADYSEKVAPTSIIQDAYINDYGLKTYAPIIMYPDFLRPDGMAKNVYYSLQAPTLPEKPLFFETFSSVLKIIRELKTFMNIFIETGLTWPKDEFSPGYDFFEHVKFDYFHTEVDQYKMIKTTPSMVRDDPCLACCSKKYGNRIFPENAPFFRGCIRISLSM